MRIVSQNMMSTYRSYFFVLVSQIILVLLTVEFTLGQVAGGQHDNLFKSYAEGRYEDCLFKAEVMIEKEKYKKDSEVCLYMAMCFYELIRIPQQAEFYKSALRYSFKQAAKARKYDKEGLIYEENADFYLKLTQWGLGAANENIEQKKHRKAATKYGYILKIDPENRNMMYARGVHTILAKDIGGGLIHIESALKDMGPGYYSDPVTEPAAIEAVVLFSNYLFEERLEDLLKEEFFIDSARSTLSIAAMMFPNSARIQNELKKLD